MDRHIKRTGISQEISVLDFLSQVINAVAVIALVIIALVYAIHKSSRSFISAVRAFLSRCFISISRMGLRSMARR